MIKFSRATDQYGCFSNFYNCKVTYDGFTYANSESAFQAQKTLSVDERRKFLNVSPKDSKRLGRNVKLREDWEEVKYDVMVGVVYAKFSQHDDLKEILLSTGDEELIENTTGWHDNIWGNCDCARCKNKIGTNLLGKALMEVREKLK